MDIVTSYDNWGGSGDRRNILSGNSVIFDGTETTYISYGNKEQITIDIIFSGLEGGKLYIDGIKVIRSSYAFINKEILLNGKSIGTFNDNVDQPLPMLTIRKNDKLTIRGQNNETGGGTYPTNIREIYFKTYFVPDKSLILHDGEYKKWNEGQEPVDEYVSTIPPLTSNSSSSLGEAFGNGYAADYYQAFDGIDSTVWQGDKPTVGVIGFKYNKPMCISRYILANYTATTRFNPKSWTFEGSNNGIDYTILDTKENITTSNPSITEATFNNNQTFLYYRFNITNISLADGTNRPHVHEIKLFEHKKESGVPPQWESISSTPPSYTQFLEQGMDSLSPLLDRKITTLEPMSMANKSEILDVGETGKVFTKTIDLKKYLDIRSIRTEVR